MTDPLKIDLTDKTLLILGRPGSGKTILANKLAPLWPNHVFLETDLYLQLYGKVDDLYPLLEDVVKYQEQGRPMIIEGVGNYRLLRKGAEWENFYPDIVLNLIVSDEQVFEVYRNERDPEKYAYLPQFEVMNNRILADYSKIYNPKPPQWIDYRNHF